MESISFKEHKYFQDAEMSASKSILFMSFYREPAAEEISDCQLAQYCWVWQSQLVLVVILVGY